MNHSTLHAAVMKSIVAVGRAPSVKELSAKFGSNPEETISSLKSLQEYHGVVLHPKSHEVWVMHPFANFPAGVCIENVKIYATIGGEVEQVVIEVENSELKTSDLVVHFPIPMDTDSVNEWCTRHGVNVGDVQPIKNVWEFAKIWYGRHLDDNWTKWTSDEAAQLFKQFNLTGEIWNLPLSSGRF